MYAQFGEDDIIAQYFADDLVGSCIDIGAANGVNGNNTYMFELKGWTVLCVEPNPNLFAQCKSHRRYTVNYAVSDENSDEETFTIFRLNNGNEEAVSSLKVDNRLIDDHSSLIKETREIKIKTRTLDSIIQEQNIFKNIDFISIDTEGTELDVLKGFDIKKWNPKLLVIENNYNTSDIENYLKDFSYKKVKRNVVNDFYLLT